MFLLETQREVFLRWFLHQAILAFLQVLNTALPSTIASWVDDYNPLGTWSLGTAWWYFLLPNL